MRKDFNENEIDILKTEIENRLEEYELYPENFDADTIGTETEYSEKMLHCIDVLEYINEHIHDDGSLAYLHGLLGRLSRGMPLTPLESNENEPDEWDKYPISIHHIIRNKRYYHFYGIYSEKDEHYTYHDPFRFEFYDIIMNKKVHSSDLPQGIIERFLDKLIPIEFPYDPDTDHVKIYIEMFDCVLREGDEPVKTLGLTHWMDGVSEKPNRIFRFFDIKKNGIDEIDWKTYSTRRQIFEKTNIISVNKDKDDNEAK